jgi:membrane protease YdiL (CAAX protease family)
VQHESANGCKRVVVKVLQCDNVTLTTLIATAMKRHALLIFFVLAFAISTPAFLALNPSATLPVSLFLLIIGSYAPAIAAAIALVIERETRETHAFKQRLRLWKVSGSSYLFALLAPATAWLCAAGIAMLVGMSAAINVTAIFFFPIIFITNLGEEIGWRGYALPRLMKRYTPLTASLLLGLVWGVFHAPLYVQRPVFGLLAGLIMLPISVCLTWLFIHSGGSVLLCTLFHATFNLGSQMLVEAQGSESLLFAALLVMCVIATFLVWRGGAGLSQRLASDAA